jgi:hypothetical protein
MGSSLERARSTTLVVVVLVLVAGTEAQQIALPTSPAVVPGRTPGTTLTKACMETVACMAYARGWPAVSSHACRAVVRSPR